MSIELGDEVKDQVTGFKGIAVARTVFLNGCIRYTVQPNGLDKDGKQFADAWFDDKQLAVTKKKKVNVEQKRTGGPVSMRPTHSLDRRG